jgi:hypothetical protein
MVFHKARLRLDWMKGGLLRPQGFPRVDPGGLPCRDDGGQEGHRYQEDRGIEEEGEEAPYELVRLLGTRSRGGRAGSGRVKQREVRWVIGGGERQFGYSGRALGGAVKKAMNVRGVWQVGQISGKTSDRAAGSCWRFENLRGTRD